MGKKYSKQARAKRKEAKAAEAAGQGEEVAPAPAPAPAAAESKEAEEPAAAAATAEETKSDKPTVAIVYYSMYGHVRVMAESIKEALGKNGCEATLYQVPETLPEDVLGKMGAPPKSDDPIATPETLAGADGIMFGIPTRFGMAAAQMKSFMDSTGSLWQSQALANKPAGIFFSTATQNGGQETTALTFVSQLTHHGMIFVPLGYPNPAMFDINEVHGGGPYGSGTLAAGDGSRMPSDAEKNVAASHAEKFAAVVKKLAA